MALLLTGATMAPAATADQCARLPSQAEEIACLRSALQASEAAHARPRKKAERQAQRAPVLPPAPQMGAEQVAAVHHDPARITPPSERVRAMVETSAVDPRGLLTLRLDNGQVWREAEAPGVPLILADDHAYPIEISRSGLGGYRMIFTALRREIVVKRIQ